MTLENWKPPSCMALEGLSYNKLPGGVGAQWKKDRALKRLEVFGKIRWMRPPDWPRRLRGHQRKTWFVIEGDEDNTAERGLPLDWVITIEGYD
jgi:hypothetical protein